MKTKDRFKLGSVRLTPKTHIAATAIALALSITVIGNKVHAQINYAETPDKPAALIPAADGVKTNGTEESAIFLTHIPDGYRDWSLIAVSRITATKGSQLRAELGNDIAIKAYRENKLPFPDGAIVVAIHWTEVPSEGNNKVLAKGFPSAGLQSFVPGSGVNMQFMVKDSKKYAATGGWGFGDFANGNPGSPALMKTCFACHEPARDRDFVFTHYTP